MKEYTVGFMFSDDLSKVALIRKNRPEWQKGMLNGIGGHVEPGETHDETMVREFEEEAGVKCTDWKPYARMSTPGEFILTVYCCRGNLDKLETKTDETIQITWVSELCIENVVENLHWLIALAIDFINDGRPSWTEITYPSTVKKDEPSEVKFSGQCQHGHNPADCKECQEVRGRRFRKDHPELVKYLDSGALR